MRKLNTPKKKNESNRIKWIVELIASYSLKESFTSSQSTH